MNNSESGRKLNQAVNTTSKAVGGAILQAKGALSNWWSAISTHPPIQPSTDVSNSVHTESDNNVPPDTNLIIEDIASTLAVDNAIAITDIYGQPNLINEVRTNTNQFSGGIVEIGHEAILPAKVYGV